MTGKFALVFGNTEYADPALAQLTAPGKDAQDLARVLKAPELCGFDEVSVLVNALSSAAIEAIDAFFDGRKPDDLLVLYFSGHGIRDELGSLYLAFSNTMRTRLRSTALKAEYVREAMDESRSKRQVLILDCCNSGAFPPGTKAELGGVMGMANALQGYGRYVLTASDATQFAWEGDRLIGETSNSVFTHFLVKGLEGDADRDSDGTISVDDLYDYAFAEIARVTPNQTPTKSASRQEGEIVLRRITRLEDIKPVGLPDDLVEAIEDQRTFVREGAVQQLEKLLNGKNLGVARSAREALERLCEQDDSLRVRKAASDVLAPIVAAEQQAREQAEQERVAAQKQQEELSAQQRAEEERQAQQDADAKRLAREQAVAEQLARTKAEADRRAQQQAEKERLALQKEEAKKLAEQKRQEELAERNKVQEAQRAAEQTEPGVQPRWISVLWIALGYTISGAIMSAASLSIGLYSADYAVRLLATFGLCIGFMTVLVFRVEHIVVRGRALLGITFGWIVGWTITGVMLSHTTSSADTLTFVLTWSLGWAISGSVTAAILRMEHVLHGWIDVLWITLAWTLGGALDAFVAWNDSGSLIFLLAIGSVFTGTLGGAVMVWLMRSVDKTLGADGRAAQGLSSPDSAKTTQAALPASRAPHWRIVLWVILGVVISSVLTKNATGDVAVNALLYGAVTGLAVALILRLERTLTDWKSIVLIAMGWTIGWAVLGNYLSDLINNGWNYHYEFSYRVTLGEGLSGGVAGMSIALALYLERVVSRRATLLWIAVAWAVAAVVDALVSFWLFIAVFNPAGMDILYALAIGSALDAAVGGIAMTWLLRKAGGQRQAA